MNGTFDTSSPTEAELKQFHSDIAGILGKYLQKGGENTAQQYKFVSAEQVLRYVGPELARLGIAVESRPTLQRFLPFTTSRGTPVIQCAVQVDLTLCRGNCRLQAGGLGQGMDTGDKAVMKANTAAIKYAWTATLCIATGDDPEADVSTSKITGEASPTDNSTTKADAPKARRVNGKPTVTLSDAVEGRTLLARIAACLTEKQIMDLKKEVQAECHKLPHGSEPRTNLGNAWTIRAAQLGATKGEQA